MSEQVRRAAEQWLAQDPDPQTRAELQALLDDGDDDALAERFGGRLEFGTAGLRGPLGAGPTRMNRVVVAQAAAGLSAYLRARHDTPTLVIGYDARHNSATFARDTAQIAAGAGVRALLLDRATPTPVVAFAIRHLGADAAVVVTASHNPPRDNGYKVYLGDGSQIVPPADADIADAIAAAGPVDALPRSDAYEVLGDEITSAYADAVAALADPTTPRDLVVAYTAMHGVGSRTVRRVVQAAGYAPVHEVAEQAEPDPEFPTVSFPNPEEPGATDLLLALGDAVGADVAIANDPDADRCAVAVPTATGWHQLSGDEVGILLADHLLRRGTPGTYATTIVSASMLGRLAAAYDRPYAETLTGFKWIGRVPELAFGYEEALGYAVAPAVARDKDGISAMLLVLELAAGLKAEGATLRDRLDAIAREHGLDSTDQLSIRVDDPAQIRDAVQRLRDAPPSVLGGLDVQRVDDLAVGSADLPPTDGLRLVLADDARVVVRPSGTEPKLKCYLEVVSATDDGVDAARIAAAARLDAIRADLAEVLGLG
ncbi:phosphomannomutase [Mumia flava]|uniref:Phosphomannomutase n=1 Tax=Mumia flava TaxID=1348852 RepID=A0A0B2BCZ0_9ACTN|nr:phospho-sugar mutase [Mumia flava]PJJ58485.1 phosphomannomutase [Mumia flava]